MIISYNKLENQPITTLNNADQIKAFLKSHELISVRGLEKKLNLPDDTIKKFLQGKRPLPAKYIPAIEGVLQEYGYAFSELEK